MERKEQGAAFTFERRKQNRAELQALLHNQVHPHLPHLSLS